MTRHAIAARWSILAASTWTAVIQLWSPTSLAYRAAGDSFLIDAINAVLLVLCAVGWADIVWRDMRGRLLLPRLSPELRHAACVALYSALGVGFLARGFIASGHDITVVVTVGVYYVLAGIGALFEAKALVDEDRGDEAPR